MRISSRLPFSNNTIIFFAVALSLGISYSSVAKTDNVKSLSPKEVDVAILASYFPTAWSGFKIVNFSNEAVEKNKSWRIDLVPPNNELHHLILRFSNVFAKPTKQFSLEILDSGSRLLASYDSEFLSNHTNFITPPLKPDTITVRVRGPVTPGELEFKIDEMRILPMANKLEPQSLTTGAILYDKMNADQRKLARGIVRLTINKQEYCTGFLVSGARIVTAYHCLAASKDFKDSAGQSVRKCADITIAFDYTDESYSGINNPRCKSVAPTSKGDPEDIAILFLEGQPPAPTGRELKLAVTDPSDGDELITLGHPIGFPIWTIPNCLVQNKPNPPKFEHDCNAIGGASGSPIMNKKGEIVGVHTDGYINESATQYEIVKAFFENSNCNKTNKNCPTNKATILSTLKKALN